MASRIHFAAPCVAIVLAQARGAATDAGAAVRAKHAPRLVIAGRGASVRATRVAFANHSLPLCASLVARSHGS